MLRSCFLSSFVEFRSTFSEKTKMWKVNYVQRTAFCSGALKIPSIELKISSIHWNELFNYLFKYQWGVYTSCKNLYKSTCPIMLYHWYHDVTKSLTFDIVLGHWYHVITLTFDSIQGQILGTLFFNIFPNIGDSQSYMAYEHLFSGGTIRYPPHWSSSSPTVLKVKFACKEILILRTYVAKKTFESDERL